MPRPASIPAHRHLVAAGCGLLLGFGCTSPTAERSPEPPRFEVSPQSSVAASITLTQLDVTLDDGAHPDSPWGQVVVDYTGAAGVLYFNLAVDGSWRVRNLPVLSREGPGIAQAASFYFDLGVSDGAEITGAQVAFDLNTEVQTQMPLAAGPMAVGTGVVDLTTGTAGRAIGYSPPPPSLAGGEAVGDKVGHSGFPNQQANNNECVPVALSNSLQWLNTKYSLGLAEADISVAAMKVVAGWTAAGAGQQWWTKKRTRFKDVLTTSTIPKFNIAEVLDAVARGCDVELRANNHVVSVTGAQKLADGKYSLDLTHDPDQKDGKAPGKEGTQTVTWDPKSKTFSGAPFIEGHAADLIVVECPKQRT